MGGYYKSHINPTAPTACDIQFCKDRHKKLLSISVFQTRRRSDWMYALPIPSLGLNIGVGFWGLCQLRLCTCGTQMIDSSGFHNGISGADGKIFPLENCQNIDLILRLFAPFHINTSSFYSVKIAERGERDLPFKYGNFTSGYHADHICVGILGPGVQ